MFISVHAMVVNNISSAKYHTFAKKKLYICRCAISLHFVNTSTEYPTSQKKKTEYPSVILLAINQHACIDSTLATEESLGEAIRSTRSKVSSREKYSSTSLSR